MIKCDGSVYSSGKGAQRRWHAEIRRIGRKETDKYPARRAGFFTGPYPTMGAAIFAGNRALRGLGWTLAEPWAHCK